MISYTGFGDYCYANSLHMCLQSSGAQDVPPVPVLECLTLMPFGAFATPLDGGAFFPSPATVNPDSGLDLALAHIGWTCRSWHAEPGAEAEALDKLRSFAAAVDHGGR